MLGKLIKHEFRATSRFMLPIFAAVFFLAIASGGSSHLVNAAENTVTLFLVKAFIFLFIISMIVTAVLPIIVMISRFYINLLGNEGYIMMTLPTNIHSLLWSKLIVSFCWFFLTAAAILAATLLEGIFLSYININYKRIAIGDIFEAFKRIGISPMTLLALISEIVVTGITYVLAVCLHFYAAMSLGHIFSNHKIMLSVVFYFVLSVAANNLAAMFINVLSRTLPIEDILSLNFNAQSFHTIILIILLMNIVSGGICYIISTASLKKGLNLS